jgi:hypothetical protein
MTTLRAFSAFLRQSRRAAPSWLLAAGLGLAASGVAAQGRPIGLPVPLPPQPVLDLPFDQAGGQQAIAALGANLPAVAAAHGLSAQQLLEQLRIDRAMRIDRKGRVFFVEDVAPPLPAPGATSMDTKVGTSSFPADQTFLLNSRPGASRTIFLDFDGHTVSGTAWNSTYGLGTIAAPAFDLDGVPGTFSADEMQRIQAIWQRVAEDYAPFDVNVTTQDPGTAALNRSGSGDAVFGVRVVVTRDFTAATSKPCGCGGFAYLSVFDQVNNETYQPAFVFFDKLGSGNEKYVAEAISHEAGHNLGLSHDGTSTSGYYTGQGSGETGWAPIMGVGYYQSLVQWSKGEYADANNLQDDLSVIPARGAPLRADDHGNDIASATAMTAAASGGLVTLSADGLISPARPSTTGGSAVVDVDVFRFEAGAGAATLAVTPSPRSPNLDIGFDVLDASGKVIASASPGATLAASASITLPAAGQYYLVVGGVGNGDPRTTGYTRYGSIGQYAVTGTAQPMSGAVPVAMAKASVTAGTTPLAVGFSSAGSYDPDGTIVGWSWSFGNGATASTADAATTYTAAGTYIATLTVTDNSGMRASSSVQVTASNPVTTVQMSVAGIRMGTSGNRGGTTANASVSIRDTSGNAVPGATVTGTWSGSVSGNASGTTGSGGTVSLTSQRAKGSGTATFTVTGVVLQGYAYVAAANTASSGTISW